jgi:hypothetical protein
VRQVQLKHEERIAEVSGTEDLNRKYHLGQVIVNVDEDLTQAFPQYRALGGTTATPEAVRNTLPNPCGRARSPAAEASDP